MPLGRQRLLQRFFNLHHCIATTRAKQKRTATPPRKRLSRPMTSIANGDKRRRASTSISKRRSNSPTVQVKRLVGRQSGSNGSPARLEQLVSSDQPVPDIRAAHADVHWRSERTRNQIHRQANEAPQNTRQALPRAPQAKSRAPWQTPFRKRKSSYRMLAARVSRKNQTPFDERGKSPIRWNHHVART